MNRKKRKIRLIDPKMQGRFIVLLLMAAGASVMVHAVLSAWAMSRLAVAVPNDGEEILAAIPGVLVQDSLITLGLMIPAFILLGMSASFRVFGPLYKFRTFLQAVAEGKHPERCQIREKDHLHDVCYLLNVVTEPIRKQQVKGASEEDGCGSCETEGELREAG